MTTPTVTELVRNGNHVGKRVELARYSIPAGERVLHGQRINGVVRFLPGGLVVLAARPGIDESDRLSFSSRALCSARPNAARKKRPNATGAPHRSSWGGVMNTAATNRSGRTGARVELARYTVGGVERVLCGQRVDGVVRLTDVPVETRGRAYLVERGLEQEGSNANAALQALIADYLAEAGVLMQCR